MELEDCSDLLNKYELLKRETVGYGLVLLNIKNFRYFNTKHGPAAGDEILALVLKALASLAGDKGCAARLYADNFALLLRCDTPEMLVERHIHALVDCLYRIDDPRVFRNLYFSMGACMLDKNLTFDEALNRANLSRKECGSLFNRSYCLEVYEQKFHDAYMERMELETETARAYKNYEFIPYLQPKVNLKTGRVSGAEALMRWRGQGGKPIPPYKFLPILDQNGYIVLLDMDVFDSVCKYLDNRLKKGLHVVPISVNISRSYFYRENMVSEYCEIFEKYDIPKSLIEFELTESITLHDVERMKQVVKDLKDYGFSCSLDDFGNGYSSFNVLLNANLDIVKMDRQFFLQNLNGDGRLVIRTVIDLIHSLNMRVVAEGIETKEHVDFLRICGCEYVQGYYFFKPMPINDFSALLDKNPLCE